RGGGGIARERRRGVLVVGITGGIGSGKGLATEFFRRHGAAVIDADEVARELTRPGAPLTHRIASEFGPEFLREDGSLDRGKLAGAVFDDPQALARLNAITHPPIMDTIDRELSRIAAEGETGIVCLVAPLLLEVEYGRGEKVDRVLVMVADEEERIRRVMARDGLTAEEVKQRIRAQMPVAEQRRRADWVVDTAGGKEQALRQLESVWRELTRQ
ncbi:MAG: dephospho-CoA kinase, partial [Armatimonadetes bacterium]|nr:dephospho-CoA kinase [Armatimonadota bacterium]